MKFKSPYIVFSAPSGGGKTTIVKLLKEKYPQTVISVSATTRPMRPGEKDGVDYYFLSKEAFEQKIKEGKFLEYEQVHGNYYGTLKEVVEQHVHIKQKTIKHSAMEKLMDAFINILAGGHGLVEINTRVRPDRALQRAFGRKACADQSLVSTTLNRCVEENVKQIRQALRQVLQTRSRSYHHPYDKQYQVLDVDMSGMQAGRQGEGVTRGYFAGQRGQRGRKLGRVVATLYGEVIVDRLYKGTAQLRQSLQELVGDTEKTLDLTPEKRQRTLIRVDGGGGCDDDVNWLLKRDYKILVKVKNWKRADKLAKSVKQWFKDPKDPEREFGWIEEPHSYVKTTRQLAIRRRDKKGHWHQRVLVTNLDNETLFWLARQPVKPHPTDEEIGRAFLGAYDLRGGAAETAFKESKQGLGITKRNKRNFHAQEMLVLLAQLAYNLIVWTREQMSKHVESWRQYGIMRIVRDAFHIAGKVKFDAQGRVCLIVFNKDHPLASKFTAGIAPLLSDYDLLLNLHQI